MMKHMHFAVAGLLVILDKAITTMILDRDDTRQRALRKRNFVVMGFVMKVLWQHHTFVMKCTLNALCLLMHMYRSIFV